MATFKSSNNKFLKLQDKITDKVWLSLIALFVLMYIASFLTKLATEGTMAYIWLGALSFGLGLAGIFLFLRSIWKWFKRPKTPKPTGLEKEAIRKIYPSTNEQNLSITNHEPMSKQLRYFLLGITTIIILVLGVMLTKYLINSSRYKELSKYETCIDECNNNKLNSDQKGDCKVSCIKKYK